MQGGPENGTTAHDHNIYCQILTDLKKEFTGRFLGKYAVKWILKVLPHLACVATLPCETLLPAKHALNDTLQGSVATYLTYCEVFNSQIKKGSLLSLPVK